MVILKKYCSDSRSKAMNPNMLPSSPNWVAIKLGFPTFTDGICWGIRRESRRNFWMDKWIGGQSLRELIEGPLTREEGNLTVSNVHIRQDKRWDVISFELPLMLKDRIKAFPVQESGKGDVLMWRHTKDGGFSTKSAYC